jgi:hypothetical protein
MQDPLTHAQGVYLIHLASAGRRGLRLPYQAATIFLRRQWVEVVSVPTVDRRRARMVTKGATFYRLTLKGDAVVKRIRRAERG